MRWLWIDKIIDFEEGKFLRAIKAVTPGEEQLHSPMDSEGNPLPPTMPSTFVIEGMAQAAGILVGTATRFSEKVVLAKITKASFDREIGVGELIRFSAELDRLDDQGAATSGFIDVRRRGPQPGAHQWERVGTVDLMFGHLDRNMSGIEFPEENFVFSDNFAFLLKDAGLSYLLP